MEQQTKVNYNYIVTNQIADSSNDSIISKEIILLKDLIKIEATVKKIVSKYRSQLFASIFENKNIYPDTVMLKNIKGIKYDLQSDEIVTKFFNNDFPIIQLEYAKMLKICGSEYGLIGDVKEIWETEPKSAVDFVANLTLTQNLFTSHINYVSLRIIQNHQIQ
ncbi:MAG: hypothetical protein IPH89_02495 [Bacteroidetes bacterium]|nr:hypothetical protein [Bacteroidota bacterium]